MFYVQRQFYWLVWPVLAEAKTERHDWVSAGQKRKLARTNPTGERVAGSRTASLPTFPPLLDQVKAFVDISVFVKDYQYASASGAPARSRRTPLMH